MSHLEFLINNLETDLKLLKQELQRLDKIQVQNQKKEEDQKVWPAEIRL